MTPADPHILRSLFQRANGGFKLGLEAMRAALTALGEPHGRQNVVLVAGTNGKGSTSALLAGALRADGRRVGLYTSPHLLRFSERIRLDGQELAPDHVAHFYRRVEAAERQIHQRLSFFECATLMALLAFEAHGADISVLEVGLGGRLDATNAVPRILSVITPIDLDHQEYLGDTVGAIAGEKADIIAPGRPVVCAPQPPEAQAAIVAVATARQAPLTWVRPERLVAAHLPPYQGVNVATARAAADALGCRRAAFETALAAFCWPGRYQWIAGAPPLLIDGAHNKAGMDALLTALAADTRIVGRRVVAIFSALRDKDAQALLHRLAPRVDALYVCPVRTPRSLSLGELQRLAPAAQAFDALPAALAAARHDAGRAGVVLIAGSLYLVSDTLFALGEPRDPPVDG